MKKIAVIFSSLLLFAACYDARHVQAELTGFTLVKIEPHWYYNNQSAFLVWKDDHKPANYYETRIKLEDTVYYWIGMQLRGPVKR